VLVMFSVLEKGGGGVECVLFVTTSNAPFQKLL
jgi:hypothetical protein